MKVAQIWSELQIRSERIQDKLAFVAILILLFLFYPDLFVVKAAPLTGDHLEQHYPWAYLFAQSLKTLHVPFWTPLVHCGFPLVAESQIGAFYLPNLLMYFLLPFHAAYSYMNLFHWFVAAWGTYHYAKQIKLSAVPSFVAALVFTFGAAYGGAYYNMTSLKTICWFPVALWFLESYLAKKQWRYWVGIALVISQSIVAGYLQMAAMTWLIFGFYAVLRILAFSEPHESRPHKFQKLVIITSSGLLALVLAWPQIFLTFQLAILSNRSGVAEAYAYVGSMSPFIIGTLLNPNLSCIATGSNLYAGWLSLYFVIIACFCSKIRQMPIFRIWTIISIGALLLALGQWSPLYVALVKMTKFYAFRIPAKFIGFFCFGMAMLSAIGFQALWDGKASKAILKLAFMFVAAILALEALLMTVSNLFLTAGRSLALKIGEWYVMRFVYGKPGHPHALDEYMNALNAFPDQILRVVAWGNVANIFFLVMAVTCLLFARMFFYRRKSLKPLLLVAVLILCIDLYAGAALDIRGDLATYKSAIQSSPVLEILRTEKAAGRLGRVYNFSAPKQPLPLTPSQNMLYGIEHLGIYSPLVTSRYYQTIGLFGGVNDSNFAVTPTPAFVLQRLQLLSFLNVSHVLAYGKLSHPELRLIYSDQPQNIYLYRNDAPHGRAYFISEVKFMPKWQELKSELLREGFDPSRVLLLEQESVSASSSLKSPAQETKFVIRETVNQADDHEWYLQCASPGYFVVPNLNFAGWSASVNQKPVEILPAFGMFQAIRIDSPGIVTIKMKYQPQWFPKVSTEQ